MVATWFRGDETKPVKIIFILFSIMLMSGLKTFSQNDNQNYTSNTEMNFSSFLNGVKYAQIIVNDNFIRNVNEFPYGGNSQAIAGLIKYLNHLGFDDVTWGSQIQNRNNLKTLCDVVIVTPTWDYIESRYTNIKIKFISCNQDYYEFKIGKSIWNNGYLDVKAAFYDNCLKFYDEKINYNENNKLQVATEMTVWNEIKLKDNFQNKVIDQIEGIYESIVETSTMPKYKIGVVKSNEKYDIIYLSGAKNSEDWKEGEIKGTITPTANENIFKTEWKMANKFLNTDAITTFDGSIMHVTISGIDKNSLIKLFPIPNNNKTQSKKIQTSGTGFAITSNGLIVTNSHVVNGSNSIYVRGIKGNFSKSYNARILIEDKNNDLAIIQIQDSTFQDLGIVPYNISKTTSDVGVSVFALGYPMKAIMGDEIKLTNGIISSKTGFQGDVTSYQISVPLQPGNSGGPLFDSKGNLVGIVNAKLTIGENVSYAIKANYLLNIIELLNKKPKLQNSSTLNGKSLSEQTKLIRNFVYIIEVE